MVQRLLGFFDDRRPHFVQGPTFGVVPPSPVPFLYASPTSVSSPTPSDVAFATLIVGELRRLRDDQAQIQSKLAMQVAPPLTPRGKVSIATQTAKDGATQTDPEAEVAAGTAAPDQCHVDELRELKEKVQQLSHLAAGVVTGLIAAATAKIATPSVMNAALEKRRSGSKVSELGTPALGQA